MADPVSTHAKTSSQLDKLRLSGWSAFALVRSHDLPIISAMFTRWDRLNLPRGISAVRYRISFIGYSIHRVIRGAPRDFFGTSTGRRGQGRSLPTQSAKSRSDRLVTFVLLSSIRLVQVAVHEVIPRALQSKSLRLSKGLPRATCQIAMPTLRMTATKAL